MRAFKYLKCCEKKRDSNGILKAIYKITVFSMLVQMNGEYFALVTYYLFIGYDVNIILYGDTTWELGTHRYNEIPSK